MIIHGGAKITTEKNFIFQQRLFLFHRKCKVLKMINSDIFLLITDKINVAFIFNYEKIKK